MKGAAAAVFWSRYGLQKEIRNFKKRNMCKSKNIDLAMVALRLMIVRVVPALYQACNVLACFALGPVAAGVCAPPRPPPISMLPVRACVTGVRSCDSCACVVL